MSILAKIIKYFASHDVSSTIRQRVWHRLDGRLDEDADEALRDVWEDSAQAQSSSGTVPLCQSQLDKAWNSVADATGIADGEERHHAVTVRMRPMLRAASWIVPVVLLAGAAWLYHESKEQSKKLAGTSFVQVFSDRGKIRHFFMPDSTEVWLNSGSVLIYPSSFSTGRRDVTLVGEAYFKVRHDDDKNFQVSVNHMKVNDLGTEFDVMSYPNIGETRVVLMSGAVSVDVGNKSYELKPNQQLSYSSMTGKTDISNVNAGDYYAWTTGALCFNDETLQNVLVSLEYAYNVRIHLLTSRYAGQRVRLRFNANEKIDNVLSVLSVIVPGLKYERQGKDIYIR